jgi:hypothetical protein
MFAKRHGPRYPKTFPLVLALLLCACEGVGIVATDNPDTKLAMADELLHDGRVMRARQQTEEAIVIFQHADDRAGLARAYREYGLVALYGGLDSDPVVLHQQGTPARPTPPEIDISDRYLIRARDLAQGTNQLYLIANIDWVLALNEVRRGNPQGACPHLDVALKEFRDAETAQPGKPLMDMPSDTKTPMDVVERLRQRVHCAP